MTELSRTQTRSRIQKNITPNLRISFKRKILNSLDKKSVHLSYRSQTHNRSLRCRPQLKNQFFVKSIRALKEELETVWYTHGVSQQHKDLFYHFTQILPSTIETEIESTKQGSSLIMKTYQLIRNRENLIQELKNCDNFYKKKELIHTYRLATLDTFDSIVNYAKTFSIQPTEFLWNERCYIEKARIDVNFVVESDYGKTQRLERDDPFLMNSHATLDLSQLSKIHKIARHFMLVTKIYPGLHIKSKKVTRLVKYKSISRLSATHEIVNLSSNREKIKKWVPNKDFIKAFCESFYQNLAFSYTDSQMKEIVKESALEIMNASLTLHSSTILYEYITETLAVLIPEIQKEAIEEEKNKEYLEIIEEVLTHTFQSEVTELVRFVVNDVVSCSIVNEIVEKCEYSSLVQEAVQEEREDSSRIVFIVFERLIDLHLANDWFREFIEEEIAQFQIDKARNSFPLHIQNQIFMYNKSQFYEKAAEEFYFNILFEYVSGYWLRQIVQNTIDEANNIPPRNMQFELTIRPRRHTYVIRSLR